MFFRISQSVSTLFTSYVNVELVTVDIGKKMYINSYKLKKSFNWPLIRVHLCSFAVALSFNSIWQAPRDGFRYGGLVYGLLYSIAMVAVALPTTMLQLAIGQLSQQDTVGVWRAVPFFKGIGYQRLLISILSLMYTSVYVALIVTIFLYTISNSIPFEECQGVYRPEYNNSDVINITTCFNETFLAPVSEKPEYYVALALIVLVLSTLLPFVLFGPFKYMKRFLYVLGPVVLILGLIILSSIGDSVNFSTFFNHDDIQAMMKPNIWFRVLIQSLVSSQTSNGYLILAGDTIYSNTNVQWTAIIFVGFNVFAGWAGLVFWYGISLDVARDTSSIAVLVEMYRVAVVKKLSIGWLLITLVMLFLASIVTMLTLLYPIYEHCRRICGRRWRYFAIAATLVSVAGSLGALAGGLPVLSAVEDVALPLLISCATVIEILAFLLIYGRKSLIDDVVFLIDNPLITCWTVGWFVTPCILLPVTIWWIVDFFIDSTLWTENYLETIMFVATIAAGFVVFFIFAVVSVAKQVQYGAVAKLRASFRPSRHWGPRDPITHYYWLARREDSQRNLPRTSYRRQLGQFSGNRSFSNINQSDEIKLDFEKKKRSNSDDWLYTVYRKKYLEELFLRSAMGSRERSKSLDWSLSGKKSFVAITSVMSAQKNYVPELNNNNVSTILR